MVEMGTTNQTTNEMRKLLTPEQMAKFLLLSDKVCKPTETRSHFLI